MCSRNELIIVLIMNFILLIKKIGWLIVGEVRGETNKKPTPDIGTASILLLK
jgi:hypothetical protein